MAFGDVGEELAGDLPAVVDQLVGVGSVVDERVLDQPGTVYQAHTVALGSSVLHGADQRVGRAGADEEVLTGGDTAGWKGVDRGEMGACSLQFPSRQVDLAGSGVAQLHPLRSRIGACGVVEDFVEDDLTGKCGAGREDGQQHRRIS